MTKAQYTSIIELIQKDLGDGFRVRLNLTSGQFIQGHPRLDGNTVIVRQDDKSAAYVDLGSIEFITAG